MNFDKAARRISNALGHTWAFLIAALAVVVWAASGPLFGFSDTWQLIINTSTTVITFLMVFVVQNTQNRDNLAIHAKLDALIAASGADDDLQRIEDQPKQDIAAKRAQAS